MTDEETREMVLAHNQQHGTNFKPWNPTLQGDGPPKDYAGGKLMYKDGEVEDAPAGHHVYQDWFWRPDGDDTVIAYEPAPAEQARPRRSLLEMREQMHWLNKAGGLGYKAHEVLENAIASIDASYREVLEDRATIATLSRKLEIAEKALEPFALISIEGVARHQKGYASITTQAEYFHRAAEALAAIWETSERAAQLSQDRFCKADLPMALRNGDHLKGPAA